MHSPNYWAVIPAAGGGTRMGATIPKQYLTLRGRPLVAHSVERLGRHPRVQGTVVILAADDDRWKEIGLTIEHDPILAVGGAERYHSVINGLRALMGHADPDDWVLVHDAARPCIRAADIDRLIDEAGDHPVGGILGLPVRDTMKRTDAKNEVTETVSRDGLWHALTPQMFRLRALINALEHAIQNNVAVTDEAQAMELMGAMPRMVEGHPDNIKVTREQDLKLAEIYLANQEQSP